jgi:hypothetical protein
MVVWVYYSAQILFLGAEFTQVYANRYGSRVVPTEGAEPITAEKRAQQGLQTEGSPSATDVGQQSATTSTARPGLLTTAALCIGFLMGRRFRSNEHLKVKESGDSSKAA